MKQEIKNKLKADLNELFDQEETLQKIRDINSVNENKPK